MRGRRSKWSMLERNYEECVNGLFLLSCEGPAAGREKKRKREGTRTGKGRTVHVVRAYLRFFNPEFGVSAQEDGCLLEFGEKPNRVGTEESAEFQFNSILQSA